MDLEKKRSDIILKLEHISKSFPGVKALDNISFEIRRGDIHALVGENGAGKSTLIKIICGVYPYGNYEGELYYNGSLCKFEKISDVDTAGIACIHQELNLCQDLSIEENMFLGRLPNRKGIVDYNTLYIRCQELLNRIGMQIDDERMINPQTKLSRLGVGQQQMVEIAKALALDVKLLILDEPTASLTEAESQHLLEILSELKQHGVTCIYISHRLDEVMKIADTITILRDGKSIETRPKIEFTKEDMVRLMVGRELTNLYPHVSHTRGKAELEVKNFTVAHATIPGKHVVEDIHFTAYQGEILGISGLMGAGRTELFSALYGTYPGKVLSGTIRIEGRDVNLSNPAAALKNGMFLVTEDRKKTGLNLLMSIRENITLAVLREYARKGILDSGKEISAAKGLSEKLKIKAPDVEAVTGTLSGGNQQKVCIAKALISNPKIIILDEPTRGIDVGAKYEIYEIINKLVDQGVAVIMISSDIEEVIGMSDRILTIYNGTVTGEFLREEATPEKLMFASTGRRQSV